MASIEALLKPVQGSAGVARVLFQGLEAVGCPVRVHFLDSRAKSRRESIYLFLLGGAHLVEDDGGSNQQNKEDERKDGFNLLKAFHFLLACGD